jgi:hypothetical protein
MCGGGRLPIEDGGGGLKRDDEAGNKVYLAVSEPLQPVNTQQQIYT